MMADLWAAAWALLSAPFPLLLLLLAAAAVVAAAVDEASHD